MDKPQTHPTPLLIHPRCILTPDAAIPGGRLLVENGVITAINPPAVPPAAQLLDARDLTLVPGLIDLQLNGSFGHDFTTDPTTIPLVAAQLPRFGVTAFLPTIITSPPETAVRAMQLLANAPRRQEQNRSASIWKALFSTRPKKAPTTPAGCVRPSRPSSKSGLPRTACGW